MALPFFYTEKYQSSENQIMLDEETSRHVVQVLRMKEGALLNLTDGGGHLLTGEIQSSNKKHCIVSIKEIKFQEPPARKISIAISLLKNPGRFEWFLEKATEIGVSRIIPLLCDRTEKEKFRRERLQSICVSAMLQSQQCWLPEFPDPVPFQIIDKWKCEENLIAHCLEDDKMKTADLLRSYSPDVLMCIGPEGDFTTDEISFALEHGFKPVSLGATRLRTETAGIVAASLLINSWQLPGA